MFFSAGQHLVRRQGAIDFPLFGEMHLYRPTFQLTGWRNQMWAHKRSWTTIAQVARAGMSTSYHLTDPPDEAALVQLRDPRGHAATSPNGPLKIFTGRAHPELARQVAGLLGCQICPASTEAFKCGETNVEVHESVRDCDVFIVQPTCNPKPNQYFMELSFLIDAMRRGGTSI